MKETPYHLNEARTLAGLQRLLRDICWDMYDDGNVYDRYEKMTELQRRRNYDTFFIQKKNKGERCIQAPRPRTKNVQYLVKTALESIYKPLDCVYGFVEGRGVVDNARIHLHRRFVWNLDLKDFFPTISREMVVRALCGPYYAMSREVAEKIAEICCMWNEDWRMWVLPQGAPTSPILSNMVCHHMDVRLMGLAERFGVTYTRYADDMTFSSNHYMMGRKNPLSEQVRRIIEEEGFCINMKKVRLQTWVGRQEVTGLTVSTKANVSKEYVKLLRRVLRTWETEGYEVAKSRFMHLYRQQHLNTRRRQWRREPSFEKIIAGKLEYMRMVKGAEDSTYVKLYKRFEEVSKVSRP